MEPPLKLGCYTTPRPTNCMCFRLPTGACEEGTGPGYEAVDMAFFAAAGCDHVMVDMPDGYANVYALAGTPAHSNGVTGDLSMRDIC